MLSTVPTLLIAAALVIVGVAIGPKVGPAKGRMWTGLAILVVGQLLSAIWVAASVGLATSGNYSMLSSLGGVFRVVSGIVFVSGVAVLASAIVVGQRSGFGSLDPSQPGAAPMGYGGYPAPTTDAGSPYVRPPDGTVPPPR